MQTALLIVGAVSEFIGIVLIAFPDLLAGALRLSAWLARAARKIEKRVRCLVRLPGRNHVVALSSGLSGFGGKRVGHGRTQGRRAPEGTVGVSVGS